MNAADARRWAGEPSERMSYSSKMQQGGEHHGDDIEHHGVSRGGPQGANVSPAAPPAAKTWASTTPGRKESDTQPGLQAKACLAAWELPMLARTRWIYCMWLAIKRYPGDRLRRMGRRRIGTPWWWYMGSDVLGSIPVLGSLESLR